MNTCLNYKTSLAIHKHNFVCIALHLCPLIPVVTIKILLAFSLPSLTELWLDHNLFQLREAILFERHPDRAAEVKSRLAKEKEELKGLAGKGNDQN